METVSLELSSYVGISIGASHYYGNLTSFPKSGGIKRVELKRVLDKKDADKLNALDRYQSYQEGDETERFDSKSQIIEYALNIWKEHFPECEILFENKGCYADPCKILYAPEPIFTKGNDLYNRAEHIGFWDFHEDIMMEIYKEWEELFK